MSNAAMSKVERVKPEIGLLEDPIKPTRLPETVAKIPMKQLTAMISRTMFAISMEESRFTLNGALLLLGDKGLTMVATDGHRLAYTHSPTAGQGSYRSLVPRKAMTEITRLCDGGGDDAQAGFSGVTFIDLIHAGEFSPSDKVKHRYT